MHPPSVGASGRDAASDDRGPCTGPRRFRWQKSLHIHSVSARDSQPVAGATPYPALPRARRAPVTAVGSHGDTPWPVWEKPCSVPLACRRGVGSRRLRNASLFILWAMYSLVLLRCGRCFSFPFYCCQHYRCPRLPLLALHPAPPTPGPQHCVPMGNVPTHIRSLDLFPAAACYGQ